MLNAMAEMTTGKRYLSIRLLYGNMKNHHNKQKGNEGNKLSLKVTLTSIFRSNCIGMFNFPYSGVVVHRLLVVERVVHGYVPVELMKYSISECFWPYKISSSLSKAIATMRNMETVIAMFCPG